MAAAKGVDITVSATTDRRAGLDGCDAVLTSYRPGGFEARVLDERIPLSHGVIGQETQGPGGFFMALRSIKVMKELLDDVAVACPGTRIFNYTNPVNIVAQAVTDHSDVPFVSLCEGPIVYPAELAEMAGLDPELLDVASVGLNHGSWSVRHTYDGRDLLPLLKDAYARRGSDPAVRPQTRRMLRLATVMDALPSEYFQYYYFEDEVRGELESKPTTRAEDILSWVPGYWEHYVEQASSGRPELDPGRSRGGIHELELAIDCMDAVFNDRGETLPVNVPNQGSRARLPGHARGRDARPLRRGGSPALADAGPADPPARSGRGARPSTSRPRPTPPGRAMPATASARWRRTRSCARSTWPSGSTRSWRTRTAPTCRRGCSQPKRCQAPFRLRNLNGAWHRLECRPRRRVEQVQRLGRHDQLEHLAVGEPAPPRDRGREARAVVGGEQRRVAVRGRLVRRGGGLARGLRRVDREDHVALGAEPLDHLQLGAEPRRARIVVRPGGPEVGRADSGDHAALVPRGGRQRDLDPGDAQPPVAQLAGREVHRGEPMNAATNTFAGASNSRSGVSHCCTVPSRRTATRSPSVIASTWSCVT